MKTAAIIIGLMLPFTASALEYRNLSLLYTDAPFTPAEAAGISLLTSVDAVSGYPDGTFKPTRTLNRAEFLKIAMASYPKIRVSPSDAIDCFPDVKATDWFAPYVCLAKKRSIIKGYPDATFKPERTVNYAEALKILSELYEYVAYSAEDEEWFAGYVRAAEFNKTALPISLEYDRALTRGQMARLAAAYRAHYEGELDMYRLSERSFDAVVAREIADSKQSSSSSSSVSSEESSSSSSAAPESITAMSRFLLLGTEQIIASGHFVPQNDEYAVVKNVTLEFRDEPKNIKKLYLIDEDGDTVATLVHDTFDPEDRTWKAENARVNRFVLPPEGKELAIKALIKDLEEGHSEELIQVKWVSMNVARLQNENESYQIIAQNTSYPPHQTAMAHLTSITNNRPPVVDLNDGEDVLLAEFTIAGETLDSAPLSVDNLTFTAYRDGVQLEDFILGVLHDTVTMQCSLGQSMYINCQNIPAAMGYIEHGDVTFQLWGTVDVNEAFTDPYLRIDIEEPGIISTTINPGVLGDVQWSDGTGNFRWIDMPKPVARGSEWR